MAVDVGRTFKFWDTKCNEKVSNLLSRTKRSTFCITTFLFSLPSAPSPQKAFGISFDRVARQNADTSEHGLASETKEGLGASTGVCELTEAGFELGRKNEV